MFDVTLIGAVVAGLLSFLSPCILPIVPFYLSYLAGVGMNQINSDAQISRAVQLRAVVASLCFAAGVITIFVGLGASAERRNTPAPPVRTGSRWPPARQRW